MQRGKSVREQLAGMVKNEQDQAKKQQYQEMLPFDVESVENPQNQ